LIISVNWFQSSDSPLRLSAVLMENVKRFRANRLNSLWVSFTSWGLSTTCILYTSSAVFKSDHVSSSVFVCGCGHGKLFLRKAVLGNYIWHYISTIGWKKDPIIRHAISSIRLQILMEQYRYTDDEHTVLLQRIIITQ